MLPQIAEMNSAHSDTQVYKTLNWDHWAPGYPKGKTANCGAIKVGTDPSPPDNGFWVDVNCADTNV